MYSGDSFFTLTGAGQIGLALVSIGLAFVVFWVAWRLMSGRQVVFRIGVAVVIFALFVWLSPQVYYAYYRVIIEGLPRQWVIGWPPFRSIVAYASFTGPQNLSAHAQGVLFWMLIASALKGLVRGGQRP